jgi:hypothetical protein
MQPTYMPWAGYFNLIARADVFVFLDDVQFEKQSWQNRNRVLVNGAAHWLTVPVRRKHLEDTINTIEVDDSRGWRRKHFELLKNNYARHPYSDKMLDLASKILNPEVQGLCDLNIGIIKNIASELGFNPHFEISSNLGIRGQRSQRLLDICEYFRCDTYLSPQGAAQYIIDDGVLSKGFVNLEFQAFDIKEYPQKGASIFAGNMSILDVLANLGGEGTRQYVLN